MQIKNLKLEQVIDIMPTQTVGNFFVFVRLHWTEFLTTLEFQENSSIKKLPFVHNHSPKTRSPVNPQPISHYWSILCRRRNYERHTHWANTKSQKFQKKAAKNKIVKCNKISSLLLTQKLVYWCFLRTCEKSSFCAWLLNQQRKMIFKILMCSIICKISVDFCNVHWSVLCYLLMVARRKSSFLVEHSYFVIKIKL